MRKAPLHSSIRLRSCHLFNFRHLLQHFRITRERLLRAWVALAYNLFLAVNYSLFLNRVTDILKFRPLLLRWLLQHLSLVLPVLTTLMVTIPTILLTIVLVITLVKIVLLILVTILVITVTGLRVISKNLCHFIGITMANSFQSVRAVKMCHLHQFAG